MSTLPPFLHTTFQKLTKNVVYDDPLEELVCSEFVDMCHRFDLSQIQDSWSWRNVHFSRELSVLLIDEKAELSKRMLFKALQLLKKHLFSLGPGRYHDIFRLKHAVTMLEHFYERPEYTYALKRITRPDGNEHALRLIRETLLLPDAFPLKDAHARRASFSALLTYLRQNVGSCFATAPAILIQQNQPLQFLEDVGQLLGTGRLTRVVEGIEYTVPLSAGWGVGDLYRPFYVGSLGENPVDALYLSPGLQAAFTAAGVAKENIKELLEKSGAFTHSTNSFDLLTADQILKTVLQYLFSVTEQEIKAFRERSARQLASEMMVTTPRSMGEKSLACSRYLKAYEEAKKAFKALTDNALLKSWEFTLASLSESKADFAKWNLYASLGVQPNEPNGIGESLYSKIQEKIAQINEEIETLQSQYEHLFAQAKYLEGRMSRASTENELGWLRAEYSLRKQEINRALVFRDTVYDKGRKLQSLYPKLIEFYGTKIRDYFQEVYDAQMHDVTATIYDDSPAGFRLLYKFGRTNTSLWTLIFSGAEYLQHLSSFFVSTEIELNQLPDFEGLEKEISELVTTLITTIKKPEFLENSFYRLARAYQEPIMKHPLEHLEKVKRKPWAYISGGTVATLVSYYWGKAKTPREEKRWVENETELLAFLIDTLKELPLSIQKTYQSEQELGMLSFSPTHAFLCKPGWKLFRKGWESETYTYTWIRDAWVFPQKRFLDEALLNSRMMDRVVEQLLYFIPLGYRSVVNNALKDFNYTMSAPEFRENVVKVLSYEKWLRTRGGLEMILEELDSILYRFLPLFPEHQLETKLKQIFEDIDEIDDMIKTDLYKRIHPVIEAVGRYKILTAEDLRNIATALLMESLNKTKSSIFFHEKLLKAMRSNGFCYPEPILFADTNWVKYLFGFTVSPGTNEVELWRFDACGTEGRPMSVWKEYLSGKNRKEWGLYINPQEYNL